MARPKPQNQPAMGPLVAWNLYLLGHADIVVHASDLSRRVEEATGRSMTRQRISAIMNAVAIEPETISLLAKAVGVEPSVLTKPA